MCDRYEIMSVIYGKIQKNVLYETSIVNKCTGIVIRDLCNARDSNVMIMFLYFIYIVKRVF